MRERSPEGGVVRWNAPLDERVLSAHTTLRLGGPASQLRVARTESDLVSAVRDAAGAPVLLLAGGSNVVVADEGFPGTAVLVRTEGVEVGRGASGADAVTVTVAAGEPWDDVCAFAVANGYSGIEALSGIPGATGATPIQNVGAYGHEVAEMIVAVRVFDRVARQLVTFNPKQCCFKYRTSIFKNSDRFVVLSVSFRLEVSPLSAPIRYAELARTLGVAPGDRAGLAEVRQAVLHLRASKGMVLDEDDRDTWSAGSFFTNPILDPAGFAALCQRVAEAGIAGTPPAWPGADDTRKTSAAWLIERAGFTKGYSAGDPTVAISAKHALALTHRGGGTTAALLSLARQIQSGVFDRFGVLLRPEPVLVNCVL